ncbi:hypothetical protein EVAR_15013_1 [Eumeta japonica]|uniref:Nucleic-acid-binding protein from transposon X-element n=1 Tax=Eumeta variegata TaxID=151549 RepID=A0A4C1X800_EUMVA|nr:hypothetical protein EVAR_15013_1 [Eumeta japonica]
MSIKCLSGIRVEVPPRKRGPGQYHCRQRECPSTQESVGKPSCVNCGQDHTTNYRECPKTLNLTTKTTNRTGKKWSFRTPPSVNRDKRNFPALRAKNSTWSFDVAFRLAPINPWRKSRLRGLPRSRRGRPPAKSFLRCLLLLR